jgi:hypothetical protein
MKKVMLMFFVILFSKNSEIVAQHESKAKAEIEKKFGAEYSNLRNMSKYEYWDGLRKYVSYIFQTDLKSKPPFKCNTNAKVSQFLKAEIWSDGGVRGVSKHGSPWYIDMKELDWNQLDKAIKEAYANKTFDIMNEFSASTLNDLIEIFEVGIVKPTGSEWAQAVSISNQVYGIGTMFYNFENPEIMSENHIRIPIYIKTKSITSNVAMSTTKEIASFNFKRDDCTKAFYYVPKIYKTGDAKPSWKTIKIEEKKYTSDEIKVFRRNSIGRELAEKKAKEEWDGLPKVLVPDSKELKDHVFFIRNFLFTCNENELRSLVLNNLDKKYFFDNSQYLLTYTGRDFVNKIVEAVFGSESINFKTIYCPTIINGIPGKNRYSFKSKNGKHTAEIVLNFETGKWLISEINIGLPSLNDFVSVDCPEPIVLETIKNDEFNFTAKMPKGFEVKNWDINNGDRKVMYSATINGTEYILIAYHYKSIQNKLTAAQMKATAEQNRKSWMLNYATYDEQLSNWTFNGIEGAEGRFSAKPSGSNVATKPTWYKSIMQGNVIYEIVISGIDWTTQNDEFMNSFTFTGKNESVSIQQDSKDVTYKKGDYVLVRTSQTQWDKGVVENVESDGRYSVFCYETNKKYVQKPENLKVDENPTQKKGGTKLPNIKIK